MPEGEGLRVSVGHDGASVQEHLRRALRQLPEVEVVPPGLIEFLQPVELPPWPETREALNYDPADADYDPDPFGLWELLELVRRNDRTDLVYGVFEKEVVVGDAALVYAIAAVADRVEDWEQAVPWLAQEQELVLPEEVADRYGEIKHSALSGSTLEISADKTDKLVRALRRRGRRLRRDDFAVRRACGIVR